MKNNKIDNFMVLQIIERETLSDKEKYHMLSAYLHVKNKTWIDSFKELDNKSLLLEVFYYGKPELFKYVVKAENEAFKHISKNAYLNEVFLSLIENRYDFDVESQIESLRNIKSVSGKNYLKKAPDSVRIPKGTVKSLNLKNKNVNMAELALIYGDGVLISKEICHVFNMKIKDKNILENYVLKYCNDYMNKLEDVSCLPGDYPQYCNITEVFDFFKKENFFIPLNAIGVFVQKSPEYFEKEYNLSSIFTSMLNHYDNKKIEQYFELLTEKEYNWIFELIEKEKNNDSWQDNVADLFSKVRCENETYQKLIVFQNKVSLTNKFSSPTQVSVKPERF